jgi:hypothetical protein
VSFTGNERRRESNSILVLGLIFFILLVSHLPLLKLPYFWDEAGYYVPVAHDLMVSGSPIPYSTISNAHPPLVMAYLALWWKIAGFTPFVTRTAMLLVAAFTLLGVFRLAQRIANLEVAVASVICTALYPVFFAQSSLAHLDLAAAGFTFWGLLAYVEKRRIALAAWFCLAVLTKETAILAPCGLFVWELLRMMRNRQTNIRQQRGILTALLVPIIPLALWYAYHYSRTGMIFGNEEFFRYNVQATIHPLRMLLALFMRIWQSFAYMNLYLLTAAGILAMWRPALHDINGERQRIAFDIQLAFLAIALIYIIAMAVIGGAVLARYMLPVVPLVIIVFVSTLRRRVQLWRWVIAIVALGFVAGLFINPPYGFAPEDNLAYRDYIQLHQNAEHFLEARYPMAKVLTAWPASAELSQPLLGYTTRPLRVVRIDDFRAEHLMAAADMRPSFDIVLVFSTKYDPPHSLLENWQAWQKIKMRYFDYHRDVPPAVAAQILGGEIVHSETRQGQWIAVIEIRVVKEAESSGGVRSKLTLTRQGV